MSGVLTVGAWFVAFYVVCLLLYRFFLSPLSKIPGPKLAALTSWYECYYDVVQPAQYVFQIQQMHAKYGPVVRIGPNDVSISDPDFVDTIYAPGASHKRDKDHVKNKALGVDSSIGGSIAHDLHRKRREALNPYFSPQRIGRLDTELASESAQLKSIFEQASRSGEVLNLSDVYFGFAHDIVYRYCFGKSPNMLNDLPLASERRANVAVVLSSVKIMLHFGWIRDIMHALPKSISAGMTPPGVRDMLNFRAYIRAEIDGILARKPENGEQPSIFTHLCDSSDLPPAEKSAQRLEDEATLIVMAGTYSPMLSLVVAHYHLMARPEILKKLRAELASSPDLSSAIQLQRLPYLAAVIQEAHRLTFGLTGRNPRVCPDETLVYETGESGKAYKFPPGTSLTASTLLIHTNESIFPDPWAFEPDRWMPSSENTPAVLAKRRQHMLSFIRGPRTCIGMHLTNAEMSVALAEAARWDLKPYQTTADDVAFCHDYHVMCPRLGSKGVRVEVLGHA